jgi:hypothetical protein
MGSEIDENITISNVRLHDCRANALGMRKNTSEPEPIRPARAINAGELKTISSRECPEYGVYTLASIIGTLFRAFLFRALINMTEPGKFAR